MANALKQFVKQRLTWADRWLTFRRQIKLIPVLLGQHPDEQLVDVFAAELLGKPCLWVISTHRLYCMEPLFSTKVHIWDGKSQIIIAQLDQPQRMVRLHVASTPDDQDSVCQVEIAFGHGEAPHAARFVNMINMLSCGHCWEQPQKLDDAMSDVEQAISDPTFIQRRLSDLLGEDSKAI